MTPSSSVADPGCLSWILIFIHPGSRILDPTTAPREGGEKFFCPTIFCSHKYRKIVNNLIFEQVKKNVLARTLRIIILFTQKFFIKGKWQ
jgi:hypothetical protein